MSVNLQLYCIWMMHVYHIAGKLSTEWYPFPALSSIRSVQQNCRFPHYPSFFPFEADRIKPIVKILIFCRWYRSRSPSVSSIFSLQKCLPRPQKKTYHTNKLSTQAFHKRNFGKNETTITMVRVFRHKSDI